jgi:hypothetical protein
MAQTHMLQAMTFCVRKITSSCSDCLVALLWSAPNIPEHPKEKEKLKLSSH